MAPSRKDSAARLLLTPMVIIMTDGEKINGWIEWYDRNCLKVNRSGAPNLLIQKHCIKYLYKEEDEK